MRPLLSAFCDGEASAEEAATLREHLRACAQLPRDAARLPGGARRRPRRWRRRCRSAARCSSAPTTPSPGSPARFGGGGGTRLGAVPGRGAGGARGAGMAALAKVAAICVGTAGGAAACVATGVVPAPLDLGAAQPERPALERQIDPVHRDGVERRQRRRTTKPRARRRSRSRGPTPVEQRPSRRRAGPRAAGRRNRPAAPSNTRRRQPAPVPEPQRRERHAALDSRQPPPGSSAREARRSARALAALAAAVAPWLVGRRRRSRDQRRGRCSRVNLRVDGGDDRWHADNDFRLDWDQPPGRELRRPASTTGSATPPGNRGHRRPDLPLRRSTAIEHLRVPPRPGIYTVEVWLEDGTGTEAGRRARALRFDDARPGAGAAAGPGGLDRPGDRPPYAPISSHPAAPPPVSGIRGYAVSVDRGAGSVPCAGPDRCSVAETDLRGGSAATRSRSDAAARGAQLRPRGRGLRLGDELGGARGRDRSASTGPRRVIALAGPRRLGRPGRCA